jgi:hypothetical protein
MLLPSYSSWLEYPNYVYWSRSTDHKTSRYVVLSSSPLPRPTRHFYGDQISRRIWSARHVACKNDERVQILLGKPNWRVHLEVLVVYGRDLNTDSDYVCWVRLPSLYDQWQASY